MILTSIKHYHILEAGKIIDYEGVPHKHLFNNYWVTLPNGREYPFKHLTRKAYKIANNTSEYLEFKSAKNLRDYIESLGFGFNFYSRNINFFTPSENTNFVKVAGKKYRKANEENVRYGNLILPVVKKLNLWATSSLVEDFVAQTDNHWQWSGTFKQYLWIRIYRKSDSKKVYFVLGIDELGQLYLQLNCQRSNHTGGTTRALPIELINAFDAYLSESDYRSRGIPMDKFEKHSWDSLIELTQNYFYQYSSLYDEVELLTTTNSNKVSKEDLYQLIPSDVPEKMKSYVNNPPTFKGKKTDWGRKQAVSSKLGQLGEELVIRNEKQKLKKLGFKEKANQVEKKLDGQGYDIFSFDENGKEIYIEVKTTKGNKEEPFYISANEKAFCELNCKKYVVYRLHNYNYLTKSARIYKIKGLELQKFNFSPTNFEVSKEQLT